MEEGTFFSKKPRPGLMQVLTGEVPNCKEAANEHWQILQFPEKQSKPKGMPGAENDRIFFSTLHYQNESH